MSGAGVEEVMVVPGLELVVVRLGRIAGEEGRPALRAGSRRAPGPAEARVARSTAVRIPSPIPATPPSASDPHRGSRGGCSGFGPVADS